MLHLDDDLQNWNFYARHECIPGYNLLADREKNHMILACDYDADYYDSHWSSEPPTCISK